jgi:LysR family transcriptional regulator, regulator for metE and metH
MILELRHLRVVEAIGREGTVTGAARALHLTQPAVSHALKELEHRLGVGLFRRDRRRMVATPEGERLLQSCAVVLAELGRVERDLEQYRDGYRAVLRIATQCYTCYNWLPPLLKQFQARHPQVTVEIVPDAKHDPIDALLEHRLDLAILFEKPDTDGIVTRRLFEDELVAIVPSGHPLGNRDHVTARDFAAEHYVSQSPIGESTLRQEVLAPAGVEPRQWSVIPLTEAIIQTVVSGLGVSVLPLWLVTPEVEAGRLQAVRVTRRGLKRVWYAAARRDRMTLPAVADLVRDLAAGGYDVACACRGPPN